MVLIDFWNWALTALFGEVPYELSWVLGVLTGILLLVLTLLVNLAFILLADRKIWASVQLRKGPNVVGAFGLLQSFADFLKYIVKEPVVPASANKFIFLLAPIVTLTLALSAWAVIPVSEGWVVSNINVGILYLFAISSLGVYGIIMGGWASNSKYPFLGAMRTAAQMVSYEVSIGFVLITVLLWAGSLNLSEIVHQQGEHGWNLFTLLFPMAVIFLISAHAETNRPPFDLPEAESELVAGYMVEYSSTPFLLYMIGEYVSIVLMCAMFTTLFLGGWLPPLDIFPLNAVPGAIWFMIKVWLIFCIFALTKAIVPRYRYDQLMRLGWKVFLPTTLVWVVVTAGYLVLTGAYPT